MKRVAFGFSLLIAACSDSGGTIPPPPPDRLAIETSSILPDGKVGEPYTTELSAKGGSGKGHLWTVASGALPSGLMLDGATIRGTPAAEAVGNASFAIQVKDDTGATATKSFLIEIRAQNITPLVLETMELSSGASGAPYSAILTARGGTGTGYAWVIAGGALPRGLALEPSATTTATIAGTPTEAGTFQFTIGVSDSSGTSAERLYSLTIADTTLPLSITTSSLPNGTIGVVYDAVIDGANGSGRDYRWSLDNGELPPGLELAEEGTPSTRLTGTPLATGQFAFAIRARDSEGQNARKIFVLVIDLAPQPIVIATQSLPNGAEGEPYNAAITAVNGTGGYIFSIDSGTLPTGLTMSSAGVISGVATTPGDFAFVVRVEDGEQRTTTRGFTITIAPVIIPIEIITTAIADGAVGVPYDFVLEAQNGFGRYGWAVTGGALPLGLRLNPNGTPTTRITGTPAASGTFTATITVFDHTNATASRSFTMFVEAPILPLIIEPATLPTARICDRYEGSVRARDGSDSGYEWELIQGSLPPGLELNRFGTPSVSFSGFIGTDAAGIYDFTLRVIDSDGGSDAEDFTLEVSDEPGGQRWAGLIGDLAILNDVEVSIVDICSENNPPPIRVSPPGIGTRDARILLDLYQFSPDGTRLTFVGDYETEAFNELFVATFTSTVPSLHHVSDPFPASTSSIEDPLWSPDGTGLIYRGDTDVDARFELFYVQFLAPDQPLPAVKISGPMVSGGTIGSAPAWSPDGTKVAYLADQIVDGQIELFVVDITAPIPTARQVNPSLTSADVNSPFFWTHDSRGLIFQSDHETAAVEELWYADVSGPGPYTSIRLNGTLAPDFDIGLDDYRISPDGTTLYYVADGPIDTGEELYLVDISTPPIFSMPIRVFPEGRVTATTDVDTAKWSPDSTRLLVRGDLDTDTVDELYLVDVSGPLPALPIKLNTPFSSTSDVDTADLDWNWSPDGTKVAFIADPQGSAWDEVFYVDVSAPQPWITYRAFTQTNDVALKALNLTFSPNSKWLAFRGDLETDGVTNIYIVDATGTIPGPAIRLNRLTTNADVLTADGDVAWKRSGDGIFYESDEGVNDIDEVWFVDLRGPMPSTPRRIHNPVITSADVDLFVVQP